MTNEMNMTDVKLLQIIGLFDFTDVSYMTDETNSSNGEN